MNSNSSSSNATVIAASVLALLLVGAGVYYLWNGDEGAPLPAPGTTEREYSNQEFGISFSYPEAYFLTEREAGSGKDTRYSIMLFEDTQFNRDLVAGKITGTEGPPAITVDVFNNMREKTPLLDWVRENNNSNFNLSIDGKLASTTVDGADALSYTWDGLYRGDSVAFVHKGNIVVASVTYNSPDDQIRNDFEEVVSSIELVE